jgi:hypothetical protein
MSEPTREDIRIDDRRWTGCKQCWSNTSHVATDAELAALGYVRAAEATMIWNDRIAREAGYVKLNMDPEAYLDAAIRHWRKSEEPFALYYVDAYQSVRTSLLGELLGSDDAA